MFCCSDIIMAKPVAILARFLLLTFLTVCLFLGVILLRAFLLQKLPPESDVCTPSEDDFIPLDDAMIKRFQTGLRFKTVSWDVGDYDVEQLRLQNDHIINSEFYISSQCIMVTIEAAAFTQLSAVMTDCMCVSCFYGC